MKPISLYLHPFASLITVLMNSLKELSYESLETKSDRYMGYLLTTGEEIKASGLHQNLKIKSVSPYLATLASRVIHLYIFIISWMKVCFRILHIYRLTSVLYTRTLHFQMDHPLFSFTESLRISQSNQTTESSRVFIRADANANLSLYLR